MPNTRGASATTVLQRCSCLTGTKQRERRGECFGQRLLHPGARSEEGAALNTMDDDHPGDWDTDDEQRVSDGEKGKEKKLARSVAVKKEPGAKRRQGVSGDDFKAAAENIPSVGRELASAVRESSKFLEPDGYENLTKMQATMDQLSALRKKLQETRDQRDAASTTSASGKATAEYVVKVSTMEKAVQMTQRTLDKYLAPPG